MSPETHGRSVRYHIGCDISFLALLEYIRSLVRYVMMSNYFLLVTFFHSAQHYTTLVPVLLIAAHAAHATQCILHKCNLMQMNQLTQIDVPHATWQNVPKSLDVLVFL